MLWRCAARRDPVHHEVPDDAIRDEQVRCLLAWLEPGAAAVEVIVGDFNADPAGPADARLTAAGFRSALCEANGAGPAVTWPSGLQGPAIDTDGEPGCLDHIWLRGDVAVESARLVVDRPAVHDPRLYPSDHVGLRARLRLGRGPQ
ncbi:MAG: endonuclease/exonuclease/phosphatase family protein [Candidatus Limnocylindrales bacterium]